MDELFNKERQKKIDEQFEEKILFYQQRREKRKAEFLELSLGEQLWVIYAAMRGEAEL